MMTYTVELVLFELRSALDRRLHFVFSHAVLIIIVAVVQQHSAPSRQLHAASC